MSEDEVREEGAEEEDEEGGELTPARRGWAGATPHPQEPIFVETGRGQTAEVQVGAPFAETIERIADEAHYGGYFRVFLNGREILEPSEMVNPDGTPKPIEPGMRIAITSYVNHGCVPANSRKAEMLILSQAGV